MNPPTPISRRTLLQGLGCTIALPWLESARLLAGDSGTANVIANAGEGQRITADAVEKSGDLADGGPAQTGQFPIVAVNGLREIGIYTRVNQQTYRHGLAGVK